MFGCVCIVCAMYVCMFYVGKYLVRCMHVCVCVCMICVGTLHYKHTGSVQAFFPQNLQAFNTWFTFICLSYCLSRMCISVMSVGACVGSWMLVGWYSVRGYVLCSFVGWIHGFRICRRRASCPDCWSPVWVRECSSRVGLVLVRGLDWCIEELQERKPKGLWRGGQRILVHVPWNIHCNTLQHTATHCNTLQHAAVKGS